MTDSGRSDVRYGSKSRNVMVIAIGCAIVSIPLVIVWLWLFVLDTKIGSDIAAARVYTLMNHIRYGTGDVSCRDELMSYARSNRTSVAVHTIVSIGTLREHARPMARDLAKLMHSPDPYVCRTAAIALGDLGKNAKGALPEIELLLRSNRSDETVWFAIEALAEMPEESLPLLELIKSKKSFEWEPFVGTVDRVVQKIENCRDSVGSKD